MRMGLIIRSTLTIISFTLCARFCTCITVLVCLQLHPDILRGDIEGFSGKLLQKVYYI